MVWREDDIGYRCRPVMSIWRWGTNQQGVWLKYEVISCVKEFFFATRIKKGDVTAMMYDSALTAEEWKLIEHPFQPKDIRGAEPVRAKRDIVNAILHLDKIGEQLPMLPPKRFPPGQTAYYHFSNWIRRGVGSGAR